MLNYIFANKELLKLIYGLVITLICFVIVLKSNRLFNLSLHQGIRYFRNAFFFYGIAFLIRYVLGSIYVPFVTDYSFLLNILFEFFLVMAGFFLLYSLLWKRIESKHENYFSSLLNMKIVIFYLIAFIIVFLDFIWSTHLFMFISQILLFAFAVSISFVNYKLKGTKGRFLKFYFAAMVLSFVAWTLNFLSASVFSWNLTILTGVYILNVIMFLLFLFGVVKLK